MGNKSCEEKVNELGICSLEKRKVRLENDSVLQVSENKSEIGEDLFSSIPECKTWNNEFKLQDGRFS